MMARKPRERKYKKPRYKKNDESSVKLELPQHISFSFDSIVDNKKFNFDFFKNDCRKEVDARKELLILLQTISNTIYLELANRSKTQLGGFETLEKGGLDIPIHSVAMTDDTKILCFRFSKQRYRMLGYLDGKYKILHIIGFDFNFTAYNHGC